MLRPLLQIDWTPNGRRGYRAASFAIDWLETESKARLAGNRMKVEKMQRFLLCYRLAGNKVKVENAMPPPLLQIAWKQNEGRECNHPLLGQIGSKQNQRGECTDSSSGTDWLENAIILFLVQIG